MSENSKNYKLVSGRPFDSLEAVLLYLDGQAGTPENPGTIIRFSEGDKLLLRYYLDENKIDQGTVIAQVTGNGYGDEKSYKYYNLVSPSIKTVYGSVEGSLADYAGVPNFERVLATVSGRDARLVYEENKDKMGWEVDFLDYPHAFIVSCKGTTKNLEEIHQAGLYIDEIHGKFWITKVEGEYSGGKCCVAKCLNDITTIEEVERLIRDAVDAAEERLREEFNSEIGRFENLVNAQLLDFGSEVDIISGLVESMGTNIENFKTEYNNRLFELGSDVAGLKTRVQMLEDNPGDEDEDENTGGVPVILFYGTTNKEFTPNAPTGGSWENGSFKISSADSTYGWRTDNVFDENYFIWMSTGTFDTISGRQYGTWTYPIRITGRDGKDGIDGTPGADGVNYEYIYSRNNDFNTAPSYPNEKFDRNKLFDDVEAAGESGVSYGVSVWYDRAMEVTEEFNTVWIAARYKEGTDWIPADHPIVWSHWGHDGTDGDGVEYIFKGSLTTTNPGAPNITSNDAIINGIIQSNDFYPGNEWGTGSRYEKVAEKLGTNSSEVATKFSSMKSLYGDNWGWSDDPQELDPEECRYVWVSIRHYNGTLGKWEAFGEPKIWSRIPSNTFTSFCFAVVPEGRDLSNVKPLGGSYSNPIPQSSTENGVVISDVIWKDSPEGEGVAWMTKSSFSAEKPNESDWSLPRIMADSDIFNVEWCGSLDSAQESAIRAKFELEPNVEGSVNLGALVKTAGTLDAAEAEFRRIMLEDVACHVSFSDDADNAWYMATCTGSGSSWTNWKLTRVKGETGNDGTSIKPTGIIKHEIYLEEGETYDETSSALLSRVTSRLPINPITNDKLVVFPHDVSEGTNIYRGTSDGSLHIYEYTGSEGWKEFKGSDIGEAYSAPNSHFIVWDSDSWMDMGGINGKNSYVHIMYAIDSTSSAAKPINVLGVGIRNVIEYIPDAENENLAPQYIGTCADENVDDPDITSSAWVWSAFKGEDGWGYEYIYCRTHVDEAPDVPTEENCDFTNWQKDDFVPQFNVRPEGMTEWTDDPQELTVEFPHEWMCWRRKQNNTWSKFIGVEGIDDAGTGKAKKWRSLADEIISGDTKVYFKAFTGRTISDYAEAGIGENGQPDSSWKLDDADTNFNENYPYLFAIREEHYTLSGYVWGAPYFVAHYSKAGRGRNVMAYISTTSISERPATPTGGSVNIENGRVTYPAGWGDSNELTGYVWVSNCDFGNDGQPITRIDGEGNEYTWTLPFCITGVPGDAGADGTSVEFVYLLLKNKETYETYLGTKESGELHEVLEQRSCVIDGTNHVYTENDYIPYNSAWTFNSWSDHPHGISETNRVEICLSRKKEEDIDGNSRWADWDGPVLWASWGEDGIDGDGIEYIFTNVPDMPSKSEMIDSLNNLYAEYEEEWDRPEIFDLIYDITGSREYTSGGFTWTDDPIDVSPEKPYEYVSVRKCTWETDGDGNEVHVWGKFGEPKLWAKWSEDGEDGVGIREINKYYLKHDSGESLSSEVYDVNKSFNEKPIPTEEWYETHEGKAEGINCWMKSGVVIDALKPFLWAIEETIFDDDTKVWSAPIVIGIYNEAKNGEDNITVDLSNANETIAISADTRLPLENYEFKTTASLWKGTELLDIYCYTTGEERDMPVDFTGWNLSCSGIDDLSTTDEITTSMVKSGKSIIITVTVGTNDRAWINSSIGKIKVSCLEYENGVVKEGGSARSTDFSILALVTDTLYSLVLDHNYIHRNNLGNPEPDYIGLSVYKRSVFKSEIEEVNLSEELASENPKFKIRYSTDGGSKALAGGNNWHFGGEDLTVTGHASENANSYYYRIEGNSSLTKNLRLEVILPNNSGEFNNNSVIIDYEDVPVISDGTSPYTLHLDNNNASVNADSNGNIYALSYPSCKATLYFGSNKITEDVSYTVVNNKNGNSINGVSISTNSNGEGVLAFSNLTIDNDTKLLELKITALVSGNAVASAIMSITKNVAAVGVNIKGSVATVNDLDNIDDPQFGDSYIVDSVVIDNETQHGVLYIWTKTDENPEGEWKFAGQIKGEDGVTPQFQINENGNWEVSTGGEYVEVGKATGDNGHAPYIGANGNWWEYDPSKAGSGDDGYYDTEIKAEGISINWLGEFMNAPSNPKLNDAYRNTVDGNSYIYNGTEWTKLVLNKPRYYLEFPGGTTFKYSNGAYSPSTITVVARCQVAGNEPTIVNNLGTVSGSNKSYLMLGTNGSEFSVITNVDTLTDVATINAPSTSSARPNYLTVQLYVDGVLEDTQDIYIIADGERGFKGAIIRGPIDWDKVEAGRSFESGADGETYLDLVAYDGKFYYCCESYNVVNPSSNTPDQDDDHWTESDGQFDFIATNLLFAKNARVDVMSSNGIYISDDNSGKVFAGMQGGTGVNFFAGLPSREATQIESANLRNSKFFVTNGGELYAKNAHIEGEIVANSGSFGTLTVGEGGTLRGSIGPLSLTENGLEITKENENHVLIDGEGNFSLPEGTTISWSNIDTDNAKLSDLTNDTGFVTSSQVPDDDKIEQIVRGTTEIDGTHIKTGTITATEIKGGTITADLLAADLLMVGNPDGGGIQLHPNATISWNNVEDQPTIPTDIDELTDITGKYALSEEKWTTEIGNSWISTADVTAQNLHVEAANVSGDLKVGDKAGIIGVGNDLTADDVVIIYAGDSDPEIAPFRVYEDGHVVARNLELTGYATTGELDLAMSDLRDEFANYDNDPITLISFDNDFDSNFYVESDWIGYNCNQEVVVDSLGFRLDYRQDEISAAALGNGNYYTPEAKADLWNSMSESERESKISSAANTYKRSTESYVAIEIIPNYTVGDPGTELYGKSNVPVLHLRYGGEDYYLDPNVWSTMLNTGDLPYIIFKNWDYTINVITDNNGSSLTPSDMSIGDLEELGSSISRVNIDLRETPLFNPNVFTFSERSYFGEDTGYVPILGSILGKFGFNTGGENIVIYKDMSEESHVTVNSYTAAGYFKRFIQNSPSVIGQNEQNYGTVQKKISEYAPKKATTQVMPAGGASMELTPTQISTLSTDMYYNNVSIPVSLGNASYWYSSSQRQNDLFSGCNVICRAYNTKTSTVISNRDIYENNAYHKKLSELNNNLSISSYDIHSAFDPGVDSHWYNQEHGVYVGDAYVLNRNFVLLNQMQISEVLTEEMLCIPVVYCPSQLYDDYGTANSNITKYYAGADVFTGMDALNYNEMNSREWWYSATTITTFIYCSRCYLMSGDNFQNIDYPGDYGRTYLGSDRIGDGWGNWRILFNIDRTNDGGGKADTSLQWINTTHPDLSDFISADYKVNTLPDYLRD